MAYRTIGHSNPGIQGADAGSNITYIICVAPDGVNAQATIRGILKEVSVYMHAVSANCKIKIFRDVGADWVYIGECGPFTGANGLAVWNTWIPVEVGDYLGIYTPNAGAGQGVDLIIGGAGNNRYHKAGDVITTSAKATWISTQWIMQIGGKVFTRVAPL